MKPSVGRIVHYVSYGTPGGEYKPACRAAVITEVTGFEPGVSLCVMNPTGLFLNQDVPEDQGTDVGNTDGPLCGSRIYHGGTWHWPERRP